MNKKIKVLIVDDHEMVRMGLINYLSIYKNIEIIGEAKDGLDCLKCIELDVPDVILMDLVMERMDGITTTKEIKKKYPQVKIIILTSFIEEDKVFPSIQAGAFSYVLKTASAIDIYNAIYQAVEGIPVIDGKVANMMLSQIQKEFPKYKTLTQREFEVLCLIGNGMANKEISEQLFIGIKTVKTHVSNILAKLELSDRTQAAIYANKEGLV